ncbi:hypothetical protein CEXT_591761, partial [Caerostris extrusa]
KFLLRALHHVSWLSWQGLPVLLPPLEIRGAPARNPPSLNPPFFHESQDAPTSPTFISQQLLQRSPKLKSRDFR